MAKPPFLLNFHKDYLIFFLRLIAGVFPVTLAFVIPIISDIHYSSDFFSKLSQTLILSSVLTFGLEKTILKEKASSRKLKSIIIIVTSLHLISFLLFEGIKYISISSLFISVNYIISNYFLTNDFRIKSLIFQFIIPNIILLVLVYFNVDPIWAIAISYGTIFFGLSTKDLFFLKNDSFKLVTGNFKGNIHLTIYTIFSILLFNAPIAFSDNLISDHDVVILNKMLKLFGLSSFLSTVVIFTYNSELRKMRSVFKIFKFYKIGTPLILLFSGIIFLIDFFEIINITIHPLTNAILSIVIYITLIGNISGHILILKSKENILPLIILTSLTITFPALILFADFSVKSVFIFYAATISMESILKSLSLVKIRLRTKE